MTLIDKKIIKFKELMDGRVKHIAQDPDDPRIGWQSQDVLAGFFRKALEDQQTELLKEIKPLIKLPTTREQQKVYDKFFAKEYYPHAFGCEKFDDGKCSCGYENA